jgi:mRNA interferase MazF
MHKQGTIVLVPFPFTDLSGDKVRPALILNDKHYGNDVLVCFISSMVSQRRSPYEILVSTDQDDFLHTGLKVTSTIRVNKIATLDTRVIIGKLGVIDRTTMATVKKILKVYLGV